MRLWRDPLARPYLILLPMSFLAGCPQDTPVDPGKDDSGTVVTGTDFDTGCILVDGTGGYAHIQDAVTVASEGSVIQLCDGTYDESVTVDKAVTITGGSQLGTIVVGQGTDPAFRITAGATVGTLTVQSTYSGIIVDGATGATVQGVTFDAPAYWGLQSADATGTTVVDVEIHQPGGGGIQVNGGSATVTNAVIDNPTGFGVQVLNGGALTMSTSVLSGIIMTSEDVTDGFAFQVMDSTLITDGNEVSVAEGMGIYAENSTLNLNNDTIDQAYYLGIYAVDGPVTMQNISLTNSVLEGAYIVGPSFVGDGVHATTTAKGSCSYSYDDWGGNNTGPWCGGLLIIADTIELTNSSASGWNNYGVYLQGNTDVDAPIDVSGLTISDTGRWGLNLYEPNATISGLTINALREPEMPAPCQDTQYIYLDRSVGVVVNGGSLVLSDSTLTGNDGWGISLIAGQLDVTSTTFGANACSGVLNYQGAANLHGNTFSQGWSNGNVWDYQGATIIDGNTFVDNHYTYTGSYEYDGHTYAYTYSGYGLDIYGYSSSSLEVMNNTFTDGDQGISFYLSTADIHDNTWSGYDGEILYSYQSSSPIRFANNSVEDFAGYLTLNYFGEVEIEDVDVGAQRAATIYYENYTDDVLTGTGSYSSQSPTIYAYGTADTPTSMTIDGLHMTDAPFGFLSSYDASLELYDVTVDAAGSGSGANLINANWQTVDPVATIDGLASTTLTGSGIYLYTSTTGPSYVDIANVNFGTVAGSAAVSAYYLGDWSLNTANLGTVGSYGVYSTANSTSPGTATLEDVTVESGDAYAFYFSGGSVAITGCSGTAGGSGLRLDAVTADATGNWFTANTQYGMVCSTTTLASCSANDLSGNGSGEHFGCDDACGISG